MGLKKLMELDAIVHENPIESFGEGGRMLIHCVDEQVQAVRGPDGALALQQAELILNARTDAFLGQFPATRRDRAERTLVLVLYEKTDDET